MKRLLVIPLLALSFVLGACTGSHYNIAPRVPAKYTKLGPAKGEACGHLAFSIDLAFIPINLNDRTERAYQNAVASVPGARALIDVQLEESWYWWVIANTRCVTITGTAVK
jgi:hypothetical protein